MAQHAQRPFALLIDDDIARRERLSRHLEALGIPTECTPRVVTGLNRIAEEDAIRLVLVDEDVAEEPGLRTLLRASHTHGARMRTIVLTSDMARREELEDRGVQCCTERPADASATAVFLDVALDGLDAAPDMALTG